ncbi:hypothetical protein ACFS07_07120 [Undibacterium arcticum]
MERFDARRHLRDGGGRLHAVFFGVLDVIKFSHGDVLTLGVFVGLASYLGLHQAGVQSPVVLLVTVVFSAIASMAVLGAVIAKFFSCCRYAAHRPSSRS